MEARLTDLEKRHNLTTKQAARLLGVAYPRYMEFRRGARNLKEYHLASVRAHMLLPRAKVKQIGDELSKKKI